MFFRSSVFGFLPSFGFRPSGFGFSVMDAIYRPFYSLYRLSTGVRHRAERRLTKGGLGVVLGAVAASMLAPDTENTVAYQAVGLLLALLLGAGAFCGSFRRPFPVRRR